MEPKITPRNKITVFDRADQFKNKGMYVFDAIKKVVMCKYCNKQFKWDRKCISENYFLSESRNSKKETALKLEETANRNIRQIPMEESMGKSKKIKTDEQKFIMSTVSAFVEANIPTGKFDDPGIRERMNKYIKGMTSVFIFFSYFKNHFENT